MTFSANVLQICHYRGCVISYSVEILVNEINNGLLFKNCPIESPLAPTVAEILWCRGSVPKIAADGGNPYWLTMPFVSLLIVRLILLDTDDTDFHRLKNWFCNYSACFAFNCLQPDCKANFLRHRWHRFSQIKKLIL